MALNNIHREPRREITESLVGTLVVLVLSIPAYLVATFLRPLEFDASFLRDWPITTFLLTFAEGVLFLAITIFMIVPAIYFLFLYVPHTFGEFVCDELAKFGKELRPNPRESRRC